MVGDWYHFDENQDLDPNPHCSEKRDTAPHSSDADRQPWPDPTWIRNIASYSILADNSLPNIWVFTSAF
jgi:hypothetical protein